MSTDVARYELSSAGPRQVTHGYYVAYSAYVRLEAEKERLAQLKEPMGDLSPDQQARAWSAVWACLKEHGILSFMGGDGTGASRAVEYIRHTFTELTRLRAEGKHG